MRDIRDVHTSSVVAHGFELFTIGGSMSRGIVSVSFSWVGCCHDFLRDRG